MMNLVYLDSICNVSYNWHKITLFLKDIKKSGQFSLPANEIGADYFYHCEEFVTFVTEKNA